MIFLDRLRILPSCPNLQSRLNIEKKPQRNETIWCFCCSCQVGVMWKDWQTSKNDVAMLWLDILIDLMAFSQAMVWKFRGLLETHHHMHRYSYGRVSASADVHCVYSWNQKDLFLLTFSHVITFISHSHSYPISKWLWLPCYNISIPPHQFPHKSFPNHFTIFHCLSDLHHPPKTPGNLAKIQGTE